MKYITLLRNVNISGKNKISMKELKQELENISYQNVTTYRNSGNIIFNCNNKNKDVITKDIHQILKNKFNLENEIVVITKEELEDILTNSPNWWGREDKTIYDNIIFIIPPAKYNELYNNIGAPNEKLEKIQEYKDTIFWSYILKEYRKTNWWSKTAQKNVSNLITIRTANTIKKILEIANN